MANKQSPRALARFKRKQRINKRAKGTPERPRLCVFRSNQHIYAQVIDDVAGITLASVSTVSAEFREMAKPKDRTEAASKIGEMIAAKAKEKGIDKVVFCRNGFIYHGRVKALADGARKGGLDF